MGKAYILPVKSNILEYNHIYLCTIIYICHLSLEKGNFSIIVVTVSISHVFRETDSLLISDTSDRHTKQKHNTKSSPDGIVMLIHNYTRIGVSSTISETVSHTPADGTPMHELSLTHRRRQYKKPSPLPWRDNKNRKSNE